MSRLFDAYIVVDWSARNVPSPKKPTADAIWVGEKTSSDFSQETYWPTRFQCLSYLKKRLVYYVKKKRKVCIGFDFSYGYPSGYAKALGLHGNSPPWMLIWQELSRLIQDEQDNHNNRYQIAAELNSRCGNGGPLWGCPQHTRLRCLNPKSPRFPFKTKAGVSLSKFRIVDTFLPRIQPAWKLAYTASVGSQILVGIPKVAQLQNDPQLADVSKVWPFETGFTPRPTPTKGPFILHVEIWPGIVSSSLDKTISIRDQAQVRAMVTWLSSLDDQGKLAPLFDTPPNLTKEQITKCFSEEGWIIGAGHNSLPRR